MEECSHIQILGLCYLAAATSAISSYAFATLYSETSRFSYKKALVYSFYFGTAGLIVSMIGFDFIGGKKFWYKVVGYASAVGIGAIKADAIIARFGLLPPQNNQPPKDK